MIPANGRSGEALQLLRRTALLSDGAGLTDGQLLEAQLWLAEAKAQ